MRYALALTLLLAAAPVHAEDHPLRLPATVFLIAAQADNLTTFYGEREYAKEGFYEANPVYSWMPTTTHTVASVGVDLGTIWLASQIGKQHPRIAAVALYTLAIMRAEMVRQNLQNLAIVKDRRATRAQRVTIPIMVINLGSSEGR